MKLTITVTILTKEESCLKDIQYLPPSETIEVTKNE